MDRSRQKDSRCYRPARTRPVSRYPGTPQVPRGGGSRGRPSRANTVRFVRVGVQLRTTAGNVYYYYYFLLYIRTQTHIRGGGGGDWFPIMFCPFFFSTVPTPSPPGRFFFPRACVCEFVSDSFFSLRSPLRA